MTFGLTIDSVLKPTRSDQKPPQWITANPGAQLMTGSFHRVPAEGWAAECHLPPGRHEFNKIVLTGGHVLERAGWDQQEQRVAPLYITSTCKV